MGKIVFNTIGSVPQAYSASKHVPWKAPSTVLQKRVVRLVCSAIRQDHTNHLFKQLGILKFVDLVKLKTSIIMFKAYHKALPDSLQKNV